MTAAQKISQVIGNTPLVEFESFREGFAPGARVLAKLEAMNPGGSVKDRAALWMVNDAEARGALKPGGTIVEPTSGNTGIGLAAIAAARGYRLVLTMPETMSAERRGLLAAYGAELVLTEGKKGMKGAIERAEQILAETPGAFMPGQFDNPANAVAHEATTGPEIWRDTAGTADIFVAGVGTGGTLTGVGRFLRGQNPGIKLVAVEPASSPVLGGGQPGLHGIQGIGAGFVPKVLQVDLIDEVVPVADADALETGRRIARQEGFLAGISSGAALWAAVQLAKREENAGKTIVVLLPDTGERYLSTALFGQG